MKPPFAPGRAPKPATLCLAILLGVGLSAGPAFAQKRVELTDLEKVEQAEQRAEEARDRSGELGEKAREAARELESAKQRRDEARDEARARKSDVDLLPESPARERARAQYREALESRSRAEDRYRRALEAESKAREEAKKAEEGAGAASRRAKKLRAAYEAKFPPAPDPGAAPAPVAPPAEEPEILIEGPPEERAPSPEMQDTPPVPPPAASPNRKELEKRIRDADKRAKKLEQEARDDDRRANSFRRRAEDAERIRRTEQAEQNRRIAEGFAKDAEKERQQADEARRQAAEARRQLADLKAGRPITPVAGSPEPGAPGTPGAPTQPVAPGIPGSPTEPGTGTTISPPAAPDAPASPQPPVPPASPQPPADSLGPITPENVLCVVPQILILRAIVANDLFGHHPFLTFPERVVLAFTLVATHRYAFTAQESQIVAWLFAGAVAILGPEECVLIAEGSGRAAGREGVRWRIEMMAESPWKGKLTIGLNGTLPNGPIEYSLEEIGRR